MKRIFFILIFALIGIIFLMPGLAIAAESPAMAHLTLRSKESNGNKVTEVTYKIYKQLTDFNNNHVLGTQLKSGTIKEVAWLEFDLKLTNLDNNLYAIEYYKGSKKQEKFILWDQTILPKDNKTIDLVFSSVEIVIKDATNQLLKDFSYELYSTAVDINGTRIATDKIYTNQKTGVLGSKKYYFQPGQYILRLKYPQIKEQQFTDLIFTINQGQNLVLENKISALRINFRSFTGNQSKSWKFKLFGKMLVNNINDYVFLGEFSTDKNGYKEVFVPSGQYLVEFKDLNSTLTTTKEISILAGEKKDLTFTSGTFLFTLRGLNKEPLNGHRVKFYHYTNGKKGSLALEKTTNNDGQIETILASDSYVLYIDGIYQGLNYQTPPVYINEKGSQNYTYILSKARLYLVNASNQQLINQMFNLYYFAQGPNGKHLPGDKIGRFSTGSLGYFDINLPPGKYVVEADGYSQTWAINVDPEQLNKIYINVLQGTPTNSKLIADSLYNTDSDNDSLSDFEEMYFYKTNAFNADTDGDSYVDKQEVQSGYDPNGFGKYIYPIFSYDKPRLTSLGMEQDIARSLKFALEEKLGKGNILVNAEDWHTIVNAYTYGGYSVSEIANTIVYGPGLVHPTIPASAWRKK